MREQLPHIVIVGGGFGGLRAAQGLGRTPAQITLIDRSNHHLFQPLLYQVATAGLSPADIASPIRSLLRDSVNTEVILDEVIDVDTQAKQVILKHSTLRIRYDYLIIATGARHGYFGQDQWEKHAPGLKSIDDATHIRRRILLAFENAEMETDPEEKRRQLAFTLVGGGPTGVEMAGSIAELARAALDADFRHIDPKLAQILLIEAGPRVLSSFPETLSERAQKSLQNLGVQIMLNSRVQDIDSEGVLVNNNKVYSKTVIWTAGVVASPAGKWLKTSTDRVGRVLVNADLSVPGLPEIFVIGDTATLKDNKGHTLPGVAPVAMQQGQYVAKLLSTRICTRDKQSFPTFVYKDKGNLATIGRSSAVADLGTIKLSGFIAWITWLFIHIFYLIGFRNRLLVIIQWAWSYFTYQRGARLITGKEDSNT